MAVAGHGSFTKAAAEVHVTQPTLSMQIQKLEDELGTTIFDRNAKKLELTPVGRDIVEQARKVTDEADRIRDIVNRHSGFIGGDFTLGIIPTVMPTLLPMFLGNFNKKYPKVRLKVEELTTKELIAKLRDGKLEAAIAATPLKTDDIEERPLYYEPFVGYVPENHRLYGKDRIDTADLDLADILLLEDGHCFRTGVINLCRADKQDAGNHFQLESGSFETMVKLSNEGLGMTLLPYLHTRDIHKGEKKHLRHFTDPVPAREISLIRHKSRLKPQVLDALHEVISGVVRGAIAFEDVEIISPV